jgi:virulence-associated protein VapD
MSNNERMYAIVFDLDTDKLKALYYNTSWNNAYKDIEKVLVKEGFKRQQESVYFGDKDKINVVSCVLAVQKLAKQLTWFSESVKDIQMLRIEENSDLGKAIKNTYL